MLLVNVVPTVGGDPPFGVMPSKDDRPPKLAVGVRPSSPERPPQPVAAKIDKTVIRVAECRSLIWVVGSALVQVTLQGNDTT